MQSLTTSTNRRPVGSINSRSGRAVRVTGAACPAYKRTSRGSTVSSVHRRMSRKAPSRSSSRSNSEIVWAQMAIDGLPSTTNASSIQRVDAGAKTGLQSRPRVSAI
jgi:hypothetical protein